MVKHEGDQRRPEDISNPYSDFSSDAELELAIARATARHPASPRTPVTEPPDDAEPSDVVTDGEHNSTGNTSNNVLHIPLHKLIDRDESLPT